MFSKGIAVNCLVSRKEGNHMSKTTKSTCIFYDEKEKRSNNGLACQILKGLYHTRAGTEKKCVCEGPNCSFYKEQDSEEG